MISAQDIHYMKAAIAQARLGVGLTAENPSVGCVIVKSGVVLGAAHTSKGGRPHAETNALEMAGGEAKGATLYVTLEPCTHQGQTPPCTDAIIKAGIKRVVIGASDVDPRVSGKSKEILENEGVEVVSGVLEENCAEVIRGFILRITQNRPFVTLKIACSLDGKIALSNGQSKWITGQQARRHAHLVRSKVDSILVGIGTVQADNPELTVRLDGVEDNVARVILDSTVRIDPQSNLVVGAKDISTHLFYSEETAGLSAVSGAGIIPHKVELGDLVSVLNVLAKEGYSNLLVEGGESVHASFLKAGLCDELLIYRAPCVLGDDALGAFGDLTIDDLEQKFGFEKIETRQLGKDVLESYRPKARKG